jgi:secreted trypsin-like serine protease
MVLANSLLGTTRVTSAVLALVAATLVACGGSALPGSEGELEGGSEFIVGGSDIDIQTAPWQVSLIGESGSHSCGGTIIAADWVLTAGHCAPVVGGMVGAGASVQSELQSSGQMRSIAEVFVLPGFSSEELLQKGHDLALIKLDSPLELNASTKAIAFAKAGDQALYAKGTAGLISGWGTIEFMGEPADQLKGLNVAVVDPEPGVASDTVAVGEPDGSGCHGDSGGPLVVRRNGSPVVIGATSFGLPGEDGNLCVRGKPTYYARTSVYADWIESTMGGASVGPSPDGQCRSKTLARWMDSSDCVQSRSDSRWYQCVSGKWRFATEESGPAGTCSQAFPLN